MDGWHRGRSLVSRLWALAVGEPDSGNPNVRFDEGTLRKQVLLYEHLVLDRANGVQVPWPGYPFRPD